MTSKPDEPNPYQDPLTGADPDVTANSKDHSIHAEPWRQKTVFENDARSGDARLRPDVHDVEHTVWDEPALSSPLAGPVPPGGLTWAGWYDSQAAQTSRLDTWLITALIVVTSAPLALLTSWFRFGTSTFDVLALVVLIPATEELLKVAGILWVVEKRPFLLSAPLQILISTTAVGLLFGFVRYSFRVQLLGVLPQVPGESVFVSVVIHGLCSLIAGLGLARIWSRAVLDRRRPDLTDGGFFGAVAVAIHVIWAAASVARQFALA